jgi:hypothetical protein
VRIRCRLTGHAGSWSYPDARCVSVLVCRRCGDVSTTQRHTWGTFEYVAAGRCDQERRCHRCGTVESRVVHTWGPWSYVGRDDVLLKLRQRHVCERCGAEEEAEFARAF